MSEYIKIDDLDDTILRLNNDGWEITRHEYKLISNVLYEMPLYSFPDREKGEWIPVYGKNGKTIMSYKCSVCMFHPKHAIITDFCGGCGADMRGKDK